MINASQSALRTSGAGRREAFIMKTAMKDKISAADYLQALLRFHIKASEVLAASGR
jgi:hypothetical protein